MSETKLKIQSYGTKFNAPEGYMLNGKIVPSVSSNNLTVELKTLAGNDPSAADPIIIRIGDTVHAITAALSVTKNAGTNWFNAGSSVLATKEIDYFVYLGYNATDGVVIGFARIPYATQYDQFSTTTTDERYCAISTISNAAAGDNYTVIGRFAAILSAGAGYTWTAPTFTSINLIQRPIFETRLVSWQGTPTWEGTAPTTLVERITKYQIVGTNCNIFFKEAWTTAGSGNDYVSIILPIDSGTGATDGSYGVALSGCLSATIHSGRPSQPSNCFIKEESPDRAYAFSTTDNIGAKFAIISGTYPIA